MIALRAYIDDPSIMFAFNGIFWTPLKREDAKDAVIPLVTVVANGKKYVCLNVTLEEALADYEKCNTTA